MVHQERYDRLFRACNDISGRRDRVAKPAIDREILSSIGAAVPNDALIAHLVAESLMLRLGRSLVEAKNVYVQKHDISQIDLFYLMGRALPQVPEGHRIGNHFLATELRRHPSAALLEIGAGKGVQVAELLLQLAGDPGALRELTIVAIEPSDESLLDATAAFAAIELPFALRVVPVQALIEQCTATELGAIHRVVGGRPLVVNSAFSLHHTVHPLGDDEARTDILRTIRAFAPRLFTLVEPNANHDTEQLTERLRSCWEHFGAVFDLIDEADIDERAKFVIKQTFFGPEIRDILGTKDASRCERHEPYESWLSRFANAGYAPYDAPAPAITLPARCTASVSRGLIRLGYRDLALLAVFAYQAVAAS